MRAICLLCLAAATFLPAAEKPNILFLFADDQCHETIRAFGQTDIDTPNLDRLVARGTTFTHAYNMGSWSGAVCVASRTMLMTGRTLWRAGAIYEGDGTDAERAAGRLWPQRMAAAGYATWFTGKWHIRTDAAKCFDRSAHIRGGMPPDGPAGYDRPRAGQPDPWSPSDPEFGGYWEGGKHWTEVTGDDAVRFLGEAASSPNPFFLHIAFNAPHDPRQAPREYVDRYPLDRIRVPESFLPEYPYKDAIGCGHDLRDERLAPFPRDAHAVKVHRQEYYAIITHLDTQIGRILEALERSGKADNTWIFFTSDHGLAVGHHGLFGKQNLYDHSLRVPFLVSGPGVAAGKRIDTPIYLQSAMATALDIAGADRADIEFASVRPLLGAPGRGLHAVYGAYLDRQRAVIEDGWKLILYPEARVTRLYHLTEDPQELRDQSGDPARQDRKRALFATLRRLQQDFEDPLDLAPVFPELK